MLVLICGSRAWSDPLRIKHRLQQLPRGARIIHGGARGADTTAALYARALGIPEQSYPARWREQGKAAGIIRNIEMLDQKPDLVIAFWDGTSTGTAHTVAEATTRGITVEVVSPKGSLAEGGKQRTR